MVAIVPLARRAVRGARTILLALPIALSSAAAQTPRAVVARAVQATARSQRASRTLLVDTREGTQLSFDLSPDGRTIVFDLLGQLWILPATGGEARPLTDAVRDQAEDLDPSFSPDGQWILFHSDRLGRRGLWLVSTTNGSLRWLAAADQSPAADWTPDGRRIVFHSALGPGPGVPGRPRQDTLQIVDVESSRVEVLRIDGLPSPSVRDPAWSADGRRILFVNARWNQYEGGRIWEVPAGGGTAAPFAGDSMRGLSPAPSPDGTRLAFFSRDSIGVVQLYVQEHGGAAPRKLTNHHDTTPLRARWTPDGRAILYSADGRLWRIDAAGGEPQPIPFRARLRLRRQHLPHVPVRFPAPGTELPARGHQGLALSPDGTRIGLIALHKLWVIDVGGRAHAVADVPSDAQGLSWSPDGAQVAWSSAQDLFATNVQTGESRRLTALPGEELRPAWSPDGRYVAFVHGEPGFQPHRVRVVRVERDPVTQLDSTLDLAADPANSQVPWAPFGQQVPQWQSDSKALVLFDGFKATAIVVPLGGRPDTLAGAPSRATFVQLLTDTALVYVSNNRLWSEPFRLEARTFGTSRPLSDEPALDVSAARDGSILYVSGQGLHVRRPDGRVERIGWPVSYRVPDAPEQLLLRNLRILDGRSTTLSAPRDILIQGGRIARIAPAGRLDAPGRPLVINGEGRIVIPGLLDLHAHLDEDAQVAGPLYNGVTTIRDLGSPIARTAALRDAVNAGIRLGPRIVFGGFQVHTTDSASGVSSEFEQWPHDEGGVERALALARAFGADQLKLYQFNRWSEAARIVALAHRGGMSVTGHVAHPLPLVAAGMDGKEHVGRGANFGRHDYLLYDDMARLFAAAGMYVVPTLVVYRFGWFPILDYNPGLLETPEAAAFLGPFLRARVAVVTRITPQQRAAQALYEAQALRYAQVVREVTRRLHEAGVTITVGTDLPYIPWAVHWELEELVRAGLTPAEAINAATGTAAQVLGAADQIGTIEAGKIADLVILDGNPLDDIRNTRRVWRVLQGGRAYEPAAILNASRRDRSGVP